MGQQALREWLEERRENAMRIAMGKRCADRDGWLQDADYFRRAIEAADACADLLKALQGALAALESISDEMTVGDRFTNAGQDLLDSLQPARDAIRAATGNPT